jgi:mono/diheme cytochrome c family protein
LSLVSFLLLSAFLSVMLSSRADSSVDELTKGAYITRIAGCADCHTIDPQNAMAGGLKLPSPFGSFFTPNITFDNETGIGHWTEDDFVIALRFGKRPDGKLLYPAFPYRAYTKLTDADLHLIYVYLKSLPHIHRQNVPHDLSLPFNQRWLMSFWQELYFGTYSDNPVQKIQRGVGAFQPGPSKSDSWNRGAYLVEAASHCTECHTPRDRMGGLEPDLWMSGSDLLGKAIPNITPDKETGRPWTKEQWLRFLRSGYSPSYHTPGDEMADVIRNTSFLTEDDRAAMVEYLMSLNPVRREP